MKVSKRAILSLATSLVLIITCTFVSSLVASAEMVEVYNDVNPTMDFKNIFDPKAGHGAEYEPNGTLTQQDGVYNINTNAFVFWWKSDNISYMYKNAEFNTGSDSVMTIRATVSEFNGNELGIDVRQSLESNTPASMVSLRPGGYYLIHRELATQEEPEYNFIELKPPLGTKDCHLKMVLNKSNGRVTGFYKMGGDVNDDTGWISVGSKALPFIKNSNSLYVGMASASADKNKQCDAKITNFSIKLEAPEGYVKDGDESKPEEEDELPPDSNPPEDTLLYETFTDNDMFPSEGVSVTNPLWKSLADDGKIVTDEAKTNRYLRTDALDTVLITAGDNEWSDYSASVDVELSKDSAISDVNKAGLTFRRRDVVIGGTNCYYLVLNNRNSKQYLTLNYVLESAKFYSEGTSLKETVVCDSGMLQGKHNIRVNVVDNVFDCYLDDVLQFSYTDTGNDRFATGCVGLVSYKADAMFDNVLVRKLYDPLGGDYDNQILGNWNDPIPDYIKNNFDVK